MRHLLEGFPRFSAHGFGGAILVLTFLALATPASSNNPPNEPTAEDPLNGETGSTVPTSPSPPTYYWRIVARDHLGLETSSPPLWFFKTKANSAPNAPSNPHPPNGNAGSTTTLLTWTCTDVDAQPLQYMVYFGDSFPLPLVATLIPDASFDPGPLQPGVTYHWFVVAYDGFLYTPAPAWSFVARVPGDVVADHELTPADAACAMQVYLVNPGCGGPGAYLTADVNCDDNVTPGDARCIHREVLGLGCDICQDAVAPAAMAEPSEFPVVSLSSWLIDGGTLIVRLRATGVDELNAFGLYTWASPDVPLLNAERRGASNHFDVWERRQVSQQFAYVGGYALADQPFGADGEFIELRYDISDGMPNSIGIDGFVDDLAGALQLYLPLHTMVDVGPIPTQLALHQNYPNPFNPRTTIAYDLPAAPTSESVRLRIVDVAGRVVRTLVDETQSGGAYRIEWEGKDDRGQLVSSGIYFSVLDARGTRQTRKLVLLK